MQDNGKSAIWEPGEVIYEAGNEATEAYLILEGYVNIETKDGLKLNRLGMGEIFGETSILLNVPRTVTAKVCAQKLVALLDTVKSLPDTPSEYDVANIKALARELENESEFVSGIR